MYLATSLIGIFLAHPPDPLPTSTNSVISVQLLAVVCAKEDATGSKNSVLAWLPS